MARAVYVALFFLSAAVAALVRAFGQRASLRFVVEEYFCVAKA